MAEDKVPGKIGPSMLEMIEKDRIDREEALKGKQKAILAESGEPTISANTRETLVVDREGDANKRPTMPHPNLDIFDEAEGDVFRLRSIHKTESTEE